MHMDDHVIDCCSLLNLYTGWRGLEELREMEGHWHICDAVLKEAEYTREYGTDGVPLLVPLKMSELTQSGLLLAARPENEAEINDYVDFASEIDDGEAQVLAIAKHRGFVLLTDDRKAARIAARPDVAVRTITTANVLQTWAGLDTKNEARVSEIVERISVLAKFSPRSDSPDYAWWTTYLNP